MRLNYIIASQKAFFCMIRRHTRVRKRRLSAANGKCCFLASLHEDVLLRACLILSITGPTKVLKTSHRISVLLGCPCTFGTFGGQWHLRAGFSPAPSSLNLLFHRFITHQNQYPLFSYLCSKQHKHIKCTAVLTLLP